MIFPAHKLGAEIKSSRRTLEILEHFSQTHRPATVSEIAELLDIPQSSTSMLLASLTAMSYLKYDKKDRTYQPTLRVMLLGSWMQDQLLSGGSLLSAMEQMRRRTGMTVLLGLRQDVYLRCMLVLRGRKQRAPGTYVSGSLIPVLRSTMGRVLLSSLEDEEIIRIANHANALMEEPHRLAVDALMKDIRHCREHGWVQNIDYPAIGLGSIAIALPTVADQPPMAVALAGETAVQTPKRDEILGVMRSILLPS